MTFLEILILSLNISILLIIKRQSRINLVLINLALIVVQVLLDQYRWQILPSYVFTGILLLLIFLNRRVNSKRRLIISKIFLSIIWLVISYIPYAFPLFDLPETTGKYQVGTSEWTLADSSRHEIYSSKPNSLRRFVAKVWYPSSVETGHGYDRNIYMPNSKIESKAFGKHSGLPDFFLSHLRLIKTNSFVGAPLATDQISFPVIIFSHGHAFYASSRQNTSLMEELASHGYFVIAINHTYESMATTFTDTNETILLDTKLVKGIQRSVARGAVRDSVIDVIIHSKDSTKEKTAFQQLMKFNGLFARSVDIWKDDVSYLVKNIIDSPPDVQFQGKLDKSRIGVIGMSLGGANAAVSCSEIPEIKAGINLDGFLYGDAFTKGISQPFTFMYSDINDQMNRFMYKKMAGDTYIMNIAGTEHTDFSEFSFFSRIGLKKGINPNYCHSIISHYSVAFFNKYLMGQNEIHLESTFARYGEVKIRRLTKITP